jgi:hypothetical protein
MVALTTRIRPPLRQRNCCDAQAPCYTIRIEMLLLAVVQWLLLIILGVIFLFIAEICVTLLLAFLGRANEKFESALVFALIFCFAGGYVAGHAGIPAGLRIDFAKPLSLSSFVIVAMLALALVFADEISDKQHRPLRGFTNRLNGWQRLWAAVALALLVPTVIICAIAVPSEDQSVIRDLQNPVCRQADVPLSAQYDQPCYDLVLFNKYNPAVRSVEQYRTAIDQKAARVTGTALLIWALLATLIYAFGTGIAWVRVGFKDAA